MVQVEIKADHIQITLGQNEILRDVSITVQDKKFIGIIGPNGSGKSTLLKCIYRVLHPDAGIVSFDDHALLKMSPRESAKKLAVVAQHNYYNFDFTIEEVVLMGRSPHKRSLERDNAEDYRIVDACIEKVGMTPFKGRSFSTLSGGEQQRIILARALAQQTPCIILDEPTNHLDIKYQLQLLDIVNAMDITIVSAIHDLNLAAMYCDYLYAMKDGHVVHQGSVEEVLTADIIRQLYEVEADISRNRFGKLHVTFYPRHLLEQEKSPLPCR